MRERLQIPLFIVFTLLLIGSVLTNLIRGVQLLGWSEIVLLVLVVFVAIGDRITNLRVSPTEFSMEQQPIEQQIHDLRVDNKRVDEAVKEEPPEKIIELVEYSLGQPRDVWSKLLFIRMTLRRLLRSLAEARGITFRPSAGIKTMNASLKQRGILDETLSHEVERIRNTTFRAEWGAGREASAEDLEFTLKNYGDVFAKLKEKMGSTLPT
jgi:hypothetical protein